MSPEYRRTRIDHLWMQLPFLGWLVVLWMLLWNQFTVLSFITGLVVAIFVTRVFRLPTVELSGRINLWWAGIFVIQFLYAVVAGAISVTAAVFQFGKQPGTAIIAVPLRYADDLVMTHVAVVTSLIPGSFVVETDRENRITYHHFIGTKNMSDVERLRAEVLLWERRIVRALGSPAQYRMLKADLAAEHSGNGLKDVTGGGASK